MNLFITEGDMTLIVYLLILNRKCTKTGFVDTLRLENTRQQSPDIIIKNPNTLKSLHYDVAIGEIDMWKVCIVLKLQKIQIKK